MKQTGAKQKKEKYFMKLKNFLYGVFAVMSGVFFCGCEINVAKSDMLMPPEAVLIDVRSAEEFKTGYIKGAINIPHTEIAEKISAVAKDKSTPLYLYCRSGRRVGIAMETLTALGYTEMVNLGGAEEAAQKLSRPLVTE